MVRRALFVIMMALPTAAGISRADDGPEQTILELEDQRIAAMIAADIPTLDRILADEMTYVHSRGQLETKTEFLARLRSGDMKYRMVHREDVHVVVLGCAAVVTGRAAMEVESKGTGSHLQLRFTDVYVDKGGRWQMVAWQSTLIQ